MIVKQKLLKELQLILNDIPDRLLIEGETIRVIARDVVGTVKRFTNVANTQLVATDLNKLLEGDIVTGDTSNATVTITSVESERIKSGETNINTKPIYCRTR